MFGFIAILFSFSFQSLACPMLAGEYKCKNSTEDIVVMQQSEAGGITTYKFHNTEMIADNQIHIVKDEPGYLATMQSWCDGDVLKSQTLATSSEHGSITNKTTINLEFQKTGKMMNLMIDYSSVGSSGNYAAKKNYDCQDVTP